ncbi:unnamed protein product, partial [Mesorhabditis belari]|uniref:Uncharacterized protein n=1 Tax=Mesorhabditis belari TaxID=2138241 RepID=A0AAF3EHV6_9BILA
MIIDKFSYPAFNELRLKYISELIVLYPEFAFKAADYIFSQEGTMTARYELLECIHTAAISLSTKTKVKEKPIMQLGPGSMSMPRVCNQLSAVVDSFATRQEPCLCLAALVARTTIAKVLPRDNFIQEYSSVFESWLMWASKLGDDPDSEEEAKKAARELISALIDFRLSTSRANDARRPSAIC